MNNNKKTALMADEQDILDYADIIKSNAAADLLYVQNLKQFILDADRPKNMPVMVGETPNSLAVAGADRKLKLIIYPRTIKKCMGKPEDIYHGHDLSFKILKKLPSELRNPVMIFKGSIPDSLVAITSLKDKNNKEIIVAISINKKEKRQLVNRVSSIYGKDDIHNYINKQINQGNLIAVNTQKANEMLQSLELQLPSEETFISFNNSISYSMQSVKGFEEFYREKALEERWRDRIDEVNSLKDRFCRISVKAVKEQPGYICYISDLRNLPPDENRIVTSLLSKQEDSLCCGLIKYGRLVEKLETQHSQRITPELVNAYTDFMALENKISLIRQEKNMLSYSKERLHRKHIKNIK